MPTLHFPWGYGPSWTQGFQWKAPILRIWTNRPWAGWIETRQHSYNKHGLNFTAMSLFFICSSWIRIVGKYLSLRNFVCSCPNCVFCTSEKLNIFMILEKNNHLVKSFGADISTPLVLNMCTSWQVSTTSVQPVLKSTRNEETISETIFLSIHCSEGVAYPTSYAWGLAGSFGSTWCWWYTTAWSPPLKNSAHGKFHEQHNWNSLWPICHFSSNAQKNPRGSFTWARIQSGTPALISKFQGFNQK